MKKFYPKNFIFKYYFYFIEERMKIFWNRYNGNKKLTNDWILENYKFTNVYRCLDRVSQYLIKNVIYRNEPKLSELDILFRILLFKVFNKIETWEYLEDKIDLICIRNFNVEKFSKLLSERKKDYPIFSNAYIMTGSHNQYLHYRYKHEKWLCMINDYFIVNKYLLKITKKKSLSEIYNLLITCPLIGEFLAYQYTIDFNYSPIINFSENSFVKAGPGAKRGLMKCFNIKGNVNYEDMIRHVQEEFCQYQKLYNYTLFKNLFGRQPTLIDIQNCFCETDKYLREKLPDLLVGNKRIKQKFKLNKEKINYYFPPKWNLEKRVCYVL